jgi:hypothetical protein
MKIQQTIWWYNRMVNLYGEDVASELAKLAAVRLGYIRP